MADRIAKRWQPYGAEITPTAVIIGEADQAGRSWLHLQAWSNPAAFPGMLAVAAIMIVPRAEPPVADLATRSRST
jgi:hypothetical protein